MLKKQDVYTPYKILLNSLNLATKDADVKRHSVRRYEEVTTGMILSAFKAEVKSLGLWKTSIGPDIDDTIIIFNGYMPRDLKMFEQVMGRQFGEFNNYIRKCWLNLIA